MAQSIPRPEHPRPDFSRDTYWNLNGDWQFAFDDANAGLREGWQNGKALDKRITVPFCYQCAASGIGDATRHPVLWYRRAFEAPALAAGQRLLLRFGAVDYRCEVYVNGLHVGGHVGGYIPFALDITFALKPGENDLCLRVEDEPDCAQPRGKQYWNDGLMGCWYTPVSGIWQTVYLEAVGATALGQAHITPDIDSGVATFDLELDACPAKPLTLCVEVSLEGKPVRACTAEVASRRLRLPVSLMGGQGIDELRLWWPHRPALYDAVLTLTDGDTVLDRVHTYFGMRSVERKDGRVLLNHTPLYQRLVLDQGYWPDSLLTAPSDDALRLDVELTLKLGYNGARKHQKIEEPRYYYWADKLGLLVWGELPSAYEFCGQEIRNLTDTLADFIARDYNHPSLITWVPLNESWGVGSIYKEPRQQALARTLYHLAKAADGTRLVSGNDGWEQVETDIFALHDYAADGDSLRDRLADRDRLERYGCDTRAGYAEGATPRGDEAFLLTEYGGIAFVNIGLQGELGGMQTWGYHDKVTDEEAFFRRFEAVTNAIRQTPHCQGYCYTQLTDVQQEINGVLTPQREPKVNVERFRALNRNPDHYPGEG